MLGQLYFAQAQLHHFNINHNWQYVIVQSILVVLFSEYLLHVSVEYLYAQTVPIHIEILLPAFCLGMITREDEDEIMIESNKVMGITEEDEDKYDDDNDDDIKEKDKNESDIKQKQEIEMAQLSNELNKELKSTKRQNELPRPRLHSNRMSNRPRIQSKKISIEEVEKLNLESFHTDQHTFDANLKHHIFVETLLENVSHHLTEEQDSGDYHVDVYEYDLEDDYNLEHYNCNESMQVFISAFFMLLVGMSMPNLFKLSTTTTTGHRSLFEYIEFNDNFRQLSSEIAVSDDIPLYMQVVHLIVVSILLIVGKMLPSFFQSDEASRIERIALSVGMCPRGEVGAGVIMISLGQGIKGPVLIISVLSLALNLCCTGVFIAVVKLLLSETYGDTIELARDSDEFVTTQSRKSRTMSIIGNHFKNHTINEREGRMSDQTHRKRTRSKVLIPVQKRKMSNF